MWLEHVAKTSKMADSASNWFIYYEVEFTRVIILDLLWFFYFSYLTTYLIYIYISIQSTFIHFELRLFRGPFLICSF